MNNRNEDNAGESLDLSDAEGGRKARRARRRAKRAWPLSWCPNFWRCFFI